MNILKMYYALLLVALADNKEQLDYAKHQVVQLITKGKHNYTITKHQQKMLSKLFDIKFAKEEDNE